MIPILGAVMGVVKLGGTLFSNYQQRKMAVSKGKIDIAQAKIEGKIKRIQTQVEADVDYDRTAAEGMRFSWKDEWFTLILSAPFVACFIPGLQDYVREGFNVLRTSTPEWYQWAFLGAIVASFGLKGWMKNKLMGGK